MSVILILVAASGIVAIGFLIAFLWAVRSGQMDDQYTPSVRILFEEKKRKKNDESIKKDQDISYTDTLISEKPDFDKESSKKFEVFKKSK